VAVDRARDEHGYELEKRSAHQQAQPADCHEMNNDESFRSPKCRVWKTEAGYHQGLAGDERQEGGSEIGHCPAGERDTGHDTAAPATARAGLCPGTARKKSNS